MIVLDSLKELFYPGHCCHCGSDYGETGREGLCDRCEADLKYFHPGGCKLCSSPQSSLASQACLAGVCRRCRLKPPVCGRLVILGWYEGPLRSIVKAGKFSGSCDALPRLVRRIQAVLGQAEDASSLERYDAVVAAPSDHRFASSLADFLAGALSATRMDPVYRLKAALRQGTLSRRGRRMNAEGAFARKDISVPQSVLVVDDVVTTGATIDAISALLFEAGAGIVDAVAVAKARPPSGTAADNKK